MSRGRHAQPPLRLTRRGRIIRDLLAGAAALGFAMFATQVSVAFFTAVVCVGHVTGLSA